MGDIRAAAVEGTTPGQAPMPPVPVRRVRDFEEMARLGDLIPPAQEPASLEMSGESAVLAELAARTVELGSPWAAARSLWPLDGPASTASETSLVSPWRRVPSALTRVPRVGSAGPEKRSQTRSQRKAGVRKIPTLFLRDWDGDPKHVTRTRNPECGWVFAVVGVPTVKWDGTCVGYLCLSDTDVVPEWYARREVKPGKTPPPNFWTVEHDDDTGKTIGWEPITQSPFAKYHAEATAMSAREFESGTYELIGPKINGNPQGWPHHELIRHGHADTIRREDVKTAPRDYDGLREWLLARPYEGVVWHHPDGRMAKLKRRDFE